MYEHFEKAVKIGSSISTSPGRQTPPLTAGEHRRYLDTGPLRPTEMSGLPKLVNITTVQAFQNTSDLFPTTLKLEITEHVFRETVVLQKRIRDFTDKST
jgi:hypothetical protein